MADADLLDSDCAKLLKLAKSNITAAQKNLNGFRVFVF